MSDVPQGLATRLAEAAGRIGGISKTEENREQHFRFRSIEAITSAVRPVFAELGIVIVPKLREVTYSDVESRRGTRGYRAVAIVDYEIRCDGEAFEAAMVGEAIDFGDKSTSKAIQMAYKYLLTELLVVGGDADPDGATVEEMSPAAKPMTVPALKREAVSRFGKTEAATAWRTLFDDGDPDGPVAADRAGEILTALEAIVEDLPESETAGR